MFSTCAQDNNTGNTRIDTRQSKTFQNSLKSTFLNQLVKKEAAILKMCYIPDTDLNVIVLSCNECVFL